MKKLFESLSNSGTLVRLTLTCAVAAAATYFTGRWIANHVDPPDKNKNEKAKKAKEQLSRLSKQFELDVNLKQLNEHELMIASNLVVPEDLPVGWADIAGLEKVIKEIRETIVLPVRHKNLLTHSQLWQAPKGILLYGPPGCGKTMLAKATAKEAGMRFINLDVSMLTDKWYGESQKLATAVFTLATKIEPCIIFVDEIESFLRNRSSSDHEVTAMMKTQFMMLWDGLETKHKSNVIVMGATNRPEDLDKAILRRMPAQFNIKLPEFEQRKQILQLILSTEKVHLNLNIERLAKLTNEFSGSDLLEMCRVAAVNRMQYFLRINEMTLNEALKNGEGYEELLKRHSDQLCISMEDLIKSYEKIINSKILMDGGFDPYSVD